MLSLVIVAASVLGMFCRKTDRRTDRQTEVKTIAAPQLTLA